MARSLRGTGNAGKRCGARAADRSQLRRTPGARADGTGDLEADSLGVDLTGWTLQEVRGVSDDGKTFTGFGINPDGRTEAWIATVDAIVLIPEPNTALLVGLGLIGLAARRSRR